MSSNPVDVGLQSFDKLIFVGVSPSSVIKKNEIEAPQCLRHRVGIDPPVDNRREALVQRSCVGKLLQRHLGRDRIGTEHEYDRICSRDQDFDTFPPVFEGIDFAAVYERVDTARRQRRFKLVGKGHILARVGNEDLGLWLPVVKYGINSSAHRDILGRIGT